MPDFCHLHCHTSYSLLDGAARIKTLLDRAAAMDMKALGITDHGNLFGSLQFYKACRAADLKPILGCEVYVSTTSRHQKKTEEDRRNQHFVLLAETDEGFRNLSRLTSAAYKEGFYYKPRIDKELLAQHAEGLIALSSCNRGEVGHHLSKENIPRATKIAEQYREIMGEDNFYLELQDHKLDWQEGINKGLLEISKNTGIPLVATNNCHYLDRDDKRAHEILLCLQTGKTMEDPYRMKYHSDEYYFKSAEEMTELFQQVPEAIENTIKIAERCNLEMELGIDNLPEYPVPESHTLFTYLEEKTKEGLQERFDTMKRLGQTCDLAVYEARLEEELKIIEKMGYPGYFLIVWDFIRHAREQDIPVGPGRGSAAGSLVAYSLKITDIDPMQYDLLFERFLNPERVSMPDFDIDFCQERRGEVIEYVSDRYGKENVGQIVTYSALSAKSVIKDVGRVLGLPFGEVNELHL